MAIIYPTYLAKESPPCGTTEAPLLIVLLEIAPGGGTISQ